MFRSTFAIEECDRQFATHLTRSTLLTTAGHIPHRSKKVYHVIRCIIKTLVVLIVIKVSPKACESVHCGPVGKEAVQKPNLALCDTNNR